MADKVTTLLAALTAEQEDVDALTLAQPAEAQLDADLAAGNVVVIEIFNAAGSETVYAGDVLQRGMAGTEAREWPVGSCVCVVEVLPCGVDPDDDDEDETPTGGESTGDEALDAVVALLGKGLVFKDGKIQLDTSGVTPGTFAGLTVDECGRVTDVSGKFPANVPRDPCCKCKTEE